MFENSKWLTFPKVEANIARSGFVSEKKPVSAELNILALGYFEAYINGNKVSDDRLVPAKSEYEKRDLTKINMPIYDTFSYTMYYLTYDVTALIGEGKNTLGVHIGAGWYGQWRSLNEGMPRWGDNTLVFELKLIFADGSTQTVYSAPENTVWTQGYIKNSQLYFGEYHELRERDDSWMLNDFDDSGWDKPVVRERPDSEIIRQEFQSDCVTRSIKPEKIYTHGDVTLYDLKETASGVGVIRFTDDARTNEIAIVRYGDALNDDMSINFHYVGGTFRMQRDFFDYDERFRGEEFYPKFTWHAGRYVEVCGCAELVRFDVIETPLGQVSTFSCNNKVLQWLFDTYVLTQRANIHGCVPSDCPHRERLGYTGDGQLTCNAVMTVFDARAMYKKWMRDIRDSQDKVGGHVQHTAPFYGGGGGPGGWGGAAVIVPYTYYKHYKDISVLKESFGSMKAYIGYMLSHSEEGLVVRGEKGGWCLGDWVPPFNKVLLPEPFVNTYFLYKCCTMLSEICEILGEDGKEYYAELAAECVASVNAHYFNKETGSFIDGVQGADAFAVDMGAGDERTLQNLVNRYEELGTFDTGIFGTDILIRILFEKGYPELAFRILVNEEENTSFGSMMKQGATTLWENWNGCDSRCHPMYGAVCAYIFSEILGIKEENGEITVKPAFLPGLGKCEGSTVINGKTVSVRVSYRCGKQKVESTVS